MSVFTVPVGRVIFCPRQRVRESFCYPVPKYVIPDLIRDSRSVDYCCLWVPGLRPGRQNGRHVRCGGRPGIASVSEGYPGATICREIHVLSETNCNMEGWPSGSAAAWPRAGAAAEPADGRQKSPRLRTFQFFARGSAEKYTFFQKQSVTWRGGRVV